MFFSWSVVGTLDTDFGAGSSGSGEYAAECVEAGFIGCWDHFGDVEDERSFGITVSDSDC